MRTPGLLGAAVVALAGATGVRLGLMESSHREWSDEAVDAEIASPGRPALMVASFQHNLAAADLFWLDLVQRIGSAEAGAPPPARLLLNRAEIATDLDPKYFTVYYATAINLTVYSKDAARSDRLLLRGQEHLPNQWEFPFLLGYNAYFLDADPGTAADYWLAAAERPGHPRFIVALASRAKYQSGDSFGAVALLEEMIPNLSGPARNDAELRLKAFQSEPTLAAYDEACQRYRDAHGRRPPDAETLRVEGYVELPAQDAYGAPIELDDDCRARTKYIPIREDEALRNVGRVGDEPSIEDHVVQ
ncbi:MAG: hypothetical protein KC933_13050 [Myxococcales bacterium]|nr:hypothetical protein [Myxococcales bacterium]MCB9646894.1 hypothetical protein [Deltaproteobacteria bacterium]